MATKQIKIAEEELTAIRQVRAKYEQIMFQLGQTDIQIHDTERILKELESRRKEHYDNYAKTQNDEKILFDNLSKKYGVGSINIDSGIITQEIPDEPTK